MKLHLARFLKLLVTCAVILVVTLMLLEGVAALALMPTATKWSIMCGSLGVLLLAAWIFTSE